MNSFEEGIPFGGISSRRPVANILSYYCINVVASHGKFDYFGIFPVSRQDICGSSLGMGSDD